MIRFLKAIFSLLIALTVILACDVIEPPYAIEDNEADTTRFPVPEFPKKTEYVKRVFLEHFTGHKCGNCPRAGEEVIRLEQIYHDQLIPLALHVTAYFAGADETGYFSNDYRTPTGDDLDYYFGIEAAGLPRGLVNRTEFNAHTILVYSDWKGRLKRSCPPILFSICRSLPNMMPTAMILPHISRSISFRIFKTPSVFLHLLWKIVS